jgi:glycosyltransferase involved in cell wall biosynthesis
MKIAILGHYGLSLKGLRGDLIAAMCEAGHEVLACAPERSEEISKAIERLGARYVTTDVQRNGLNPFADVRYLSCLIRLFKRERIQLSLAYSIKPVIYGSLAARFARIPASSIIPGLGHTFMRSGVSGRCLLSFIQVLYRVALATNHKVFFQNQDDSSFFQERRLVRARQVELVNGSGVNLTEFTELPLPFGPPVFLLVARLIRSKGILEYTRAAKYLKARHPNARFLLAGRFETGPQRIAPEELDAWVHSGAVEYVGESQDVREVLASTSVFVLPSWYREGVPRSILEAMACGRAVVTTDSVGCRETVCDGRNGFLIPPQDHVMLIAAMERFLTNPELIPRMGAASRILAQERFDVRDVNRTILGSLGLLPRQKGDRSALIPLAPEYHPKSHF